MQAAQQCQVLGQKYPAVAKHNYPYIITQQQQAIGDCHFCGQARFSCQWRIGLAKAGHLPTQPSSGLEICRNSKSFGGMVGTAMFDTACKMHLSAAADCVCAYLASVGFATKPLQSSISGPSWRKTSVPGPSMPTLLHPGYATVSCRQSIVIYIYRHGSRDVERNDLGVRVKRSSSRHARDLL